MKEVVFESFFEYFLLKNYSLKIENKKFFKQLYQVFFKFLGRILIVEINENRLLGKLKGNTPEERYTYFIEKNSNNDNYWKQINKKYPELFQKLNIEMNKRIFFVKKIYNDFCKDRRELINKKLINHKSIKDISFLGDFHNGKCVACIYFDNEKLIYKPSNLSNEKFLNNFIDYLNTFLKNDYRLKTYNLLSSKDYGWVEFVSNDRLRDEDKVHLYYKKAGVLIMVANVLQMSDLHFENIICSKDTPYILDAESMFYVSNVDTEDDQNKSVKLISNFLNYSVISSELLPIKSIEEIFNGDVSGLFGGKICVDTHSLENIYRDDIKYKKSKIWINKNNNIPILSNGKEINPYNYKNDILDGFKEAYKIILRNKNNFINYILSKATNIRSRVLFRNTKEYALILNLTGSPVYSKKISKIIKKLESTVDKKIFISERKQLLNLDIPYFYVNTDSTEVLDMSGNLIKKLEVSPISKTINRIKNISENDLERQIELIKYSIDSNEKLYKNGDKYQNYQFIDINQTNVLNESINTLVKIIKGNAVLSDDGSVSWLNIFIDDDENIRLGPINELDMYNGLSGIGIALIEYLKCNNDNKIKLIVNNLYRQALKYINNKEKLRDMSLFNGKLGIIEFINKYESIILKEHYESNIINEYLNELIGRINEIDNYPDVISGIAGIVIYLYFNFGDSEKVRNVIMILDDHLLKKAIYKEDYVYWKLGDNNLKNASFAHGNSGIMVALLIGYIISNDIKYFNLFKKAWNYEKKLKLKDGWKDKRTKNNNSSANWCHGSTGITISKIIILKLDEKYKILSLSQKNEIMDELSHGIKNIIHKGLNINNFALCHGLIGNILVLEYCYENFFNDKHFLDIIVKNEKSILNFGKNNDWHLGLSNGHIYPYGLMTGIAGVLYGLLLMKDENLKLDVLGCFIKF